MDRNKTLKGLPPDIDLTDGRDFRPGTVNPMYIESPEMGSLPWDKDGKPKTKKSGMTFANYTWTLDNSFMEINDYVEDSAYSFNNINFSGNRVVVSKPNTPIRKVSKKYTLEEDLTIVKTTKNKKIFLRAINRIMKRIPNVRRGMDTTIIIPGCRDDMAVKYKGYTRHIYTWFNDSNSFNSNSSIRKFTSEMVDDTDDLTILPLCIPEAKISYDELNDNVLLTGMGEELYNKQVAYKFFKEFNKLRDRNYPKNHWNKEICRQCNRTYLVCDDHDMGCPYCVMDRALYKRHHHPKLYRIKERSIDIHHSKYRHFDEDVTDAHYAVFHRDGDYFDNLIYMDAGLHLIRLEQGQHELRVGFGHQSYDYDDDSDEIRNNRFDQYPLVSMKSRHFNKLGMHQDSIDEIRDIINTLARV